MDLIGVVVVIAALILGLGAHLYTRKNDSPAEQIAEAVLKAKGIDIDFSADNKKVNSDDGID